MPGFTLKGKVQLDGSQWKAGLDQAKRDANKWTTEVSTMVRTRLAKAFVLAAVARGVDVKTARAGQIRDQSNALGLDIETFQKADFAAQQSAASIADVSSAIQRLAGSSIDALRGSKDILEAYERFGITAEHLSRLKAKPGDLMFLLADLVQKGVNPTALGDIRKIAGRSAGNLLPAFRAGFAEAGQTAVGRGAVVSEEEILKLASVGDEITTQKSKIDRFTTGAIFTTIKGLEGISSIASEIVRVVPEGIDSVSRVIRTEMRESRLEEKRLLQNIADNTKPLNE